MDCMQCFNYSVKEITHSPVDAERSFEWGLAPKIEKLRALGVVMLLLNSD